MLVLLPAGIRTSRLTVRLGLQRARAPPLQCLARDAWQQLGILYLDITFICDKKLCPALAIHHFNT